MVVRRLFPSTLAYLTSWPRFGVAVLFVFLIPMLVGITMPVAP